MNKNVFQKILKNTGYLAGARSMNMIVRAVYAIALARFLGAEQYGLYNYALGWYLAFIPFTSLGLWAVISRDMGKNKTRGKQTVAQTFALRGILSLITAIICALAGWLINNDEITRELLLIFSIALIGRALANWAEHVFNACSESRYVFILEAFFRPLEAILSIIILFYGGGLLLLAIVHCLIWWSQGTLAVFILQKQLFIVRPEWQAKGIYRLLRKGSLLGVSAFLVVWFLQGPLLLARQTGFNLFDLGQIALLVQIFTLLSSIPQMLGTAALPVLSNTEHQTGDKDKEILIISLKITWLAGMFVCITGYLSGSWLIPTFFGEQFEKAGTHLGLILYLLVPWTWGNLLQLRMLSKGLLRLPTLSLLFGGGAMTLSFFQMAQYWGISGVFFALNTGLWLWVLTLYFLQKLPLPLLFNSLLITLVVSVIIYFLDNRIEIALICLLVIISGFWFAIMSETERNFIRKKLILY